MSDTTIIDLPASPMYCCYTITTLGKSQIKNIQVVLTTGVHLRLNTIASVQLASGFIDTSVKSLMSFINSTIHNALQRASIKHCLR